MKFVRTTPRAQSGCVTAGNPIKIIKPGGWCAADEMRNDIGSRVCRAHGQGRPPLGRPRRPSWCPSPAGPRHDRHAAWFSSSAGFLKQASIQSVRTAEAAVRKERYSLWFCAIIVFASPCENILTFSAISREYAFMIFVESLKCLTKRKNGSSDWTEMQEKQRHRASRRRGPAAGLWGREASSAGFPGKASNGRAWRVTCAHVALDASSQPCPRSRWARDNGTDSQHRGSQETTE